MKNSELLSVAYGSLPPGTYGWVTNFKADPNEASMHSWTGRAYTGAESQASLIDSVTADNTFFCTSVMTLQDASPFRRTKANFHRLAVLVADDADPTVVEGQVSYVLETSPGNHQIGILLDADDPACHQLGTIDLVMQAMAKAKLIKADSSGNNAVRYVRLPQGKNTKRRESGEWTVGVKVWNPGVCYSLEDACSAFGLDLAEILKSRASDVPKTPTGNGSDYATLIAALAADADHERAYHDPLLKLSAKFISTGMHAGAAVETLRGLMQAVKPSKAAELERWQSRYDRIPHMVNGAEKKYRKPVEIALPGTEEERKSLLLTLPQLGNATKNVKWLVKQLVPADACGMLFGASGTFKSFIALDMALHIAHAMRWCDKRTDGGGVVYVAAEGGAGIYRRVRAWHQHHALSEPDNFHVCVTPLLLAEEDQVSTLREAIATLPQRPSLVVVDTLSQTFTGDENSSTDIATYLRLLNTHLRAAFGCTVLVIHHTGHAASERPRGSSAITANLDFLLGCFRPSPDTLVAQVEVIKQKDGDKLPAQHFELHREVLEKDEDGEEVSSLTASWHDAVKACKESALGKVGIYAEAIYEYLDEVRHEDDLKKLVRKLCEENGVKAESVTRTYRRAMESLTERRVIKQTGMRQWRRI